MLNNAVGPAIPHLIQIYSTSTNIFISTLQLIYSNKGHFLQESNHTFLPHVILFENLIKQFCLIFKKLTLFQNENIKIVVLTGLAPAFTSNLILILCHSPRTHLILYFFSRSILVVQRLYSELFNILRVSTLLKLSVSHCSATALIYLKTKLFEKY